MINPREFPSRGKILGVHVDKVILQPVGTTYQLHLERAAEVSAQVGARLVDGVVRVRARKVWTVPSGGLFVAPIFGPPRIVQGRVRALDEHEMVVNAGLPIVVELPVASSAFDLANGPISVGTLVNVTVLPGARFELLARTRAGATSTVE